MGQGSNDGTVFKLEWLRSNGSAHDQALLTHPFFSTPGPFLGNVQQQQAPATSRHSFYKRRQQVAHVRRLQLVRFGLAKTNKLEKQSKRPGWRRNRESLLTWELHTMCTRPRNNCTELQVQRDPSEQKVELCTEISPKSGFSTKRTLLLWKTVAEDWTSGSKTWDPVTTRPGTR